MESIVCTNGVMESIVWGVLDTGVVEAKCLLTARGRAPLYLFGTQDLASEVLNTFAAGFTAVSDTTRQNMVTRLII
jgi:hypothetical protein